MKVMPSTINDKTTNDLCKPFMEASLAREPEPAVARLTNPAR